MNDASRPAQRGFTLIELLIATLILGLVLGALIVPLSVQFEARRLNEARAEMATIKEALLGFAVANGRLPCPDNGTDNIAPDGMEDTTIEDPDPDDDDDTELAVTNCGSDDRNARRGWLPATTLGVSQTDPWGRYYRYQVATSFMLAAQPGSGCSGDPRVSFCNQGDITVRRRGDDPTSGPTETRSYVNIATNVAALVLSTGPNGRGGRAPGLPLIAFADTSVGQDEHKNSSDVEAEVSAADFALILGGAARGSERVVGCSDGTDEGPEALPLCAFDDVVDWIPATQLMARLLQAGWLP